MFRKLPDIGYSRERILTKDDDFLDLDWIETGSSNLVILCHGLEGNSNRTYIKGMAITYKNAGWDVLAWNNRSCGGEMNKSLRLYHHGDIGDLTEVITRSLAEKYRNILLIGFSMGGSQIIKYLGSRKKEIPKEIKGGIVFSVPFNLGDSAKELSKYSNTIYRKRFLKKLKNKILHKHVQYPNMVPISGIDQISNFYQFDSRYTAPMYGFSNAEEFYAGSNAGKYLHHIDIPVLAVNAANDPMLPDSCYPIEESENHKFFYLEIPKSGGHVGFFDKKEERYWSERRALEFTYSTILIE